MIHRIPLPAHALNGKLLCLVNHWTKPLNLLLVGNYWEEICFHTIVSLHAPMVLSQTWLQLYNSHSNWAAAKVGSWSFFSQSYL